jgi:predicted permease
MPDFKQYVRDHMPAPGGPDARQAEIIEELALEFQEAYERFLRAGMSPDVAWRTVQTAARPWPRLAGELRAALGPPVPEPRPPEGVRLRPLRWIAEWRRDGGLALRQLRQAPGFAVAAVLMLALGIGANTAVFSLLNALMMRPLPVLQPQQLVFLGAAHAEGDTEGYPDGATQAFSYRFFRDFHQRTAVFSDVAAILSYLVETHGRMGGDPELVPLKVELVSGSYFPTLGLTPAYGRLLGPGDDVTPGAHPVAVARAGWWRDHGGGAAFAPRSVALNGTVYTIVGVAPASFSGVTVGQAPDLWIPLAMQGQVSPDRSGLADPWYQTLHLLARLKPGVSISQAQSNTDFVFRKILIGYLGVAPPADAMADIQHAFIPLVPAATGRSRLRGEFDQPLQTLMFVVGLVLLIACANVANLLLARAARRRREMALRLALGATRARLVRQLLVESLVVSLLGAGLGLAVASWASRLLLAMVSPASATLPLVLSPDATVLGFTLGLAVATVLLFGILPALRTTAISPGTVLKQTEARGSESHRFARVLVAGQVAISVVLLAGAALFLQSLHRRLAIPLGFDPDNVLRLELDARAAGYQPGARLNAVQQAIETRISSVPGVEASSFALSVFDGGGWRQSDVGPRGTDYQLPPHTILNIVGPDYFAVMRMRLIAGRGIENGDTATSRRVAVINEAMARKTFRGSALGQVFSVGNNANWRDVSVVGIVSNAKYFSPDENDLPAAFFSERQNQEYILNSLVVRTAIDPGAIGSAIQASIADVDPNIGVENIRTLRQMVGDFSLDARLIAALCIVFALLATGLAAIGVYAVMAYSTARRGTEFGIRMALGAQPRDVRRNVLGAALRVAILGVAAGLVLALAVSRLVVSQLYQVDSTSPAALAAAALAMVAVTLLAAYLPARRATRIDPSIALRGE